MTAISTQNITIATVVARSNRDVLAEGELLYHSS